MVKSVCQNHTFSNGTNDFVIEGKTLKLTIDQGFSISSLIKKYVKNVNKIRRIKHEKSVF